VFHASLLLLVVSLKNAVQPRMDTDVHGLKTDCFDERLHPIAEPLILFPSVFIRVHPWFLQVQVPDFGLRWKDGKADVSLNNCIDSPPSLR